MNVERKTKIAYFPVDNLWNPAKNGQKQSERAYWGLPITNGGGA